MLVSLMLCGIPQVSVANNLNLDALTEIVTTSKSEPRELTTDILADYNQGNELSQVFALLLQLKPEATLDVISSAMRLMPENAAQLAQIALKNGVSSSTVTIAAIDAGIDPTLVAAETAAGIETVTPRPTPVSPKASISRN